MTRHVSGTGKFLRVAIALGFVWAAGTDAYGADACPHHDAIPGRDTQPVHTSADLAGLHTTTETASHTHVADAGRDGHAAGTETDHGAEGPCACITHCQAPPGELAIAPATVRTVPAAVLTVVAELPILRPEILGPRHHLFELHRPNAPPRAS